MPAFLFCLGSALRTSKWNRVPETVVASMSYGRWVRKGRGTQQARSMLPKAVPSRAGGSCSTMTLRSALPAIQRGAGLTSQERCCPSRGWPGTRSTGQTPSRENQLDAGAQAAVTQQRERATLRGSWLSVGQLDAAKQRKHRDRWPCPCVDSVWTSWRGDSMRDWGRRIQTRQQESGWQCSAAMPLSEGPVARKALLWPQGADTGV